MGHMASLPELVDTTDWIPPEHPLIQEENNYGAGGEENEDGRESEEAGGKRQKYAYRGDDVRPFYSMPADAIQLHVSELFDSEKVPLHTGFVTVVLKNADAGVHLVSYQCLRRSTAEETVHKVEVEKENKGNSSVTSQQQQEITKKKRRIKFGRSWQF